MDLEELSPARVLTLRYMIESRLSAPGSTSKLVAERMRQGLAAISEGYQGDGQARVRADLADLLLLCRGLNQREEHACRARYASAAGIVGYERLVRTADLADGSGEEIIDIRPRDLDGNPLDGWVRARGIRARLPSHAEVADHLASQGTRNADGAPMTAGAVEKLLRTASEKIATAIRARRAMAELEERAAG